MTFSTINVFEMPETSKATETTTDLPKPTFGSLSTVLKEVIERNNASKETSQLTIGTTEYD